MTCEPHWTIYLSALLVPTVAIFGIIIAYKQWLTAQDKLKLDMFEKRFAVYDAARKLINLVFLNGRSTEEERSEFYIRTREAKWLLSAEIDAYLVEQIYDKAVDLYVLGLEHEGMTYGDERTTNAHRQSDIRKLMRKQFEVLDEKFSPFLSYPSIKPSLWFYFLCWTKKWVGRLQSK